MLRQLEIYDEFVERSKEYHVMSMYKEDLTLVNAVDGHWVAEATGYGVYIISRPQLYDFALESNPQGANHTWQKDFSLQENKDSTMVRWSDNSSYRSDILVGANGAYSVVRQELYKDLKESRKLPTRDDVALPFSCVCLVGQTAPLDPEEFTQLQGDLSKNMAILGTETMCTWATFATKQNALCRMVIHFLDKESAKRNDSFCNSEWGPEAAEALAREVRVFKLPGGKMKKYSLLENM
ncbi:hypothetical protein BGZ82_000986 [Podila clonocystis]|nr:hypothetical protein BGZ82_000986 [Podila clonocystis]